MLIFALVNACLLAVILAYLVYEARRVRRERLVGRTVVLHTCRPDDRTIRGVVHAVHADRVVLRDAVAILAGGHEQPLGGVQAVPRTNVSFFQIIESTRPTGLPEDGEA